MTEEHKLLPSAAWKPRAALAGLILIVGAAGTLRLNDCDLFNPDSPRYVMYSRPIVEGYGYRMIDVPGEAFYSWRPPGLSLLIAPAAWLCPDDTAAAKMIVLATLLFLVLAVFGCVRRISGNAWALLAAALVGLNPYSVFYATEVLTEVPYTAITIAVLWLLQSQETKPSRRQLFLAAALLAFLPLVRTIGIAFIAAVGLWAITSRRRWRCLPAPLAGVLGLAAWTLRNAQVGGATYTNSVTGELARVGIIGFLAKAAETGVFYAKALLGLLVPGFVGKPAYASAIVGASPDLEAWRIPALLIGGMIVLVSLYHMVRSRNEGGALALLYFVLYAGLLTIWPWRDERFVWPLVPLVWMFVKRGHMPTVVAAGTEAVRIPARRPVLVFRTALASVFCFALLLWQVSDCTRMAASNIQFRRDGDRFYRETIPSFYYCDWHAAGRWIREHSQPSARLLTWHAAVGVTAHRYQQRVMFETQTPEQLHQRIRDFSAQYLVIPTAQFGDGFAWHLLTGDPAFRYTPVYDARNVMVLEVSPNREGTVRVNDHGLAERLAACKQAVGRMPGRVDLQVRLGSMLSEAGQRDEALAVLQNAARHGGNARLYFEMGQLLMQSGQYTEAARAYDAAAGMPYAEPIADSLRHSAVRARELAARKPGDLTLEVQAAQMLDLAKKSLALLRYDGALRLVERALTLNSDSTEGLYLRGAIRQRHGEWEAAEKDFEAALAAGSEPSQRKLRLLRMARALEQNAPSSFRVGADEFPVDPRALSDHLQLAKLYREDGTPGLGLAVLERAAESLGDSPELLRTLAEAYRNYALCDSALVLYQQVLAMNADDADALRGVNECNALLTSPRQPAAASERTIGGRMTAGLQN